MSVYKVIYNYYNDLLNFLSNEDSSNKGLTNLFSNITPEKKKIIISKLSEMMMKFHNAFNNEKKYWKNTKKDQSLFRIIYFLMLLFSFIIIFVFLIFRFKEIKAENLKGNSKGITYGKSIFTYLIILQIILTIFFFIIPY